MNVPVWQKNSGKTSYDTIRCRLQSFSIGKINHPFVTRWLISIFRLSTFFLFSSLCILLWCPMKTLLGNNLIPLEHCHVNLIYKFYLFYKLYCFIFQQQKNCFGKSAYITAIKIKRNLGNSIYIVKNDLA